MNTTTQGHYHQETVDLHNKFGAAITMLAVVNGNKGFGFGVTIANAGLQPLVPGAIAIFAEGMVDQSYKTPDEFQVYADEIATKTDADLVVMMLAWAGDDADRDKTGFALAGKIIPPRPVLSKLLLMMAVNIGLLQTASPNRYGYHKTKH